MSIRPGVMIVALTVVLAGFPGSAAPQTADPGMVGPPAAARDFAADRGLLIAKGTTLPAGTGYVNALALPLSMGAAYGVTDRFTIHGGTSFWSIGAGVPSGYLSARYAVVRAPNVGLALGGLGVAIADDGSVTAAGWPYVTVTAGTDRVAVSGLVGVGSSTEIFESDFNGQLLLEGLLEVVIEPALKLMLEGLYLGEDSDPAGAAGVRWSPSRLALEAGVVHVFERGGAGSTVWPWAGVSVRW